ncbi:MAG: hypothetical protein D6675_04940 [Gemmatimonadetes bacterium]|nr:MAG: hypothetical protein D6675_04940 [Gemmatimonadota bacterium]
MPDNIFYQDLQRGGQLLEQDTVQLYDRISGLTNPIIFYEATRETSLEIREQEIVANCHELLQFLSELEFNLLLRRSDYDEWVIEILNMIQKAFTSALNILSPVEMALIAELKDAQIRLNDYIGSQKTAETKVLTNVISETVKQNIGDEFISLNLDTLDLEANQYIRAPRFQVQGMEISLFLETEKEIDRVPIHDYSANIIVVHILQVVIDFLRDMGFDGSNNKQCADFLQTYMDALTTQTTASLMENELLFNYEVDHDQGEMVEMLYQKITMHILDKIPPMLLKDDEFGVSRPFSVDDNPIVELQRSYKRYKGGLGLVCPPSLKDRRNQIFQRGTSVVVGLPRIAQGQKISLIHYHFSLSLSPEERDYLKSNSDRCILLLYSEAVTDQLRALEHVPLKVSEVELYRF